MNIFQPRVDTRPVDGAFIDAKGRTHKGVDPATLEPVGDPKDELAFYVCGINSDVERQRCDMDKLRGMGYRLLGVHNATAGVMRDLGQCVADKLDKGNNPAVTTVKGLLKTAMETSQKLVLIGHSQGALICSRALTETRDEMLAQGLSQNQVDEKLSAVTLHTAGGAAYRFPDGPKYHHRINWLDPIALVAGLMMLKMPGISAGAGATVETFCRFQGLSSRFECSGSKVTPSAMDRAVHGVGVYF